MDTSVDAANNNLARCKLFAISEDLDMQEKLSYEEKLKMFENDVETLYEFALSKGFSTAQIQTCFSPMLGGDSSIGKRIINGSWRTLTVLSVLVGIVAVLWCAPVTNKMIVVHTKLLSMQTIPLWDWTSLYHEDCLVNNPFLKEKIMNGEDCAPCTELDEVHNINESEHELVSEYLQHEVPFIVTDSVKDWPRNDEGELMFSLNRLKRLFRDHKILTEAAVDCEFVSSMKTKDNMDEFVKALETENFPDRFHVSWENCDVNAAKIFRMLATRPSFFPAFAETSPFNQVIIARGEYDEEEFKLPQQIDSASLIIAIQGKMKINVQPHIDCRAFKCTDHSFVIGPGEAAVVPSHIWNMTYTPKSEGYALGYATTLTWDE